MFGKGEKQRTKLNVQERTQSLFLAAFTKVKRLSFYPSAQTHWGQIVDFDLWHHNWLVTPFVLPFLSLVLPKRGHTTLWRLFGLSKLPRSQLHAKATELPVVALGLLVDFTSEFSPRSVLSCHSHTYPTAPLQNCPLHPLRPRSCFHAGLRMKSAPVMPFPSLLCRAKACSPSLCSAASPHAPA